MSDDITDISGSARRSFAGVGGSDDSGGSGDSGGTGVPSGSFTGGGSIDVGGGGSGGSPEDDSGSLDPRSGRLERIAIDRDLVEAESVAEGSTGVDVSAPRDADAQPVSQAERERIAESTDLQAEEIAAVDPEGERVILTDEARTDRAADAFERDQRRILAGRERVPLGVDVDNDSFRVDRRGELETTPEFREDVQAARQRDLEARIAGTTPGVQPDDVRFRDDGLELTEGSRRDIARSAAAADAPLRDEDDFVVEGEGEDMDVRRRARPFFEDQREAIGLDTPDESRIRRGLREGGEVAGIRLPGSQQIQSFFEGAAEQREETLPSPGTVARESDIPGEEQIPTITEGDQVRGVGAIADLPGAVDSAFGVAERGADLAQARGETTLAERAEAADANDVGLDPDAFDEEFERQRERTEQDIDTATEVARQRPGIFVGAIGAGAAFGVAAGAGIGAAGRAATRGVRRRRAPTVDFEELSGELPRQRGQSQNPEFSQAAMRDTDVAADEFRRRMDDIDAETRAELGLGDDVDGLAFSGRADEAVREFGEFTGWGRREFDAPAGTSEIEGMFFSADLSPLRLPDGSAGVFSSGRPSIGLPRLRDRTQIAAADLDIDTMPESVRTLDRQTDDGGRVRGDATRFLREDADEGVGFVRSQAIRTPEQEVIVPPGSTLRQTSTRFNVETEGGEVVPTRVFEPQRVDGEPDTPARTGVDSVDNAIASAEETFGLGPSRPTSRIDRRETPDVEVGPTGGSAPVGGEPAPTVGGTTAPRSPFNVDADARPVRTPDADSRPSSGPTSRRAVADVAGGSGRVASRAVEEPTDVFGVSAFETSVSTPSSVFGESAPRSGSSPSTSSPPSPPSSPSAPSNPSTESPPSPPSTPSTPSPPSTPSTPSPPSTPSTPSPPSIPSTPSPPTTPTIPPRPDLDDRPDEPEPRWGDDGPQTPLFGNPIIGGFGDFAGGLVRVEGRGREREPAFLGDQGTDLGPFGGVGL